MSSKRRKMRIDAGEEEQSAKTNELDDDEESLRCLECEVGFTTKRYLYNHLVHHIRQPFVKLDRVQQTNPPLKITLKNRSGNSFEIVSPVTSPVSSEPGWHSNSLDEAPKEDHRSSDEFLESPEREEKPDEDRSSGDQEEGGKETENQVKDEQDQADQDPFEGLDGNETNVESTQSTSNPPEEEDEQSNVSFSADLAAVIGGAFLADIDSPISFEEGSNTEQQGEELLEGPKEADTAESSDRTGENTGDNTAGVATLTNGSHASPPYGSIPGAEPTPPPEPSPTGATEYPKIKIKTTGLFKDPEPRGCTITEITDDNPNGDPSLSNNHPTPIWTTPSLEDPLKLPEDDAHLLNLFNNNDRAKDLGFSTSSDNEFISLETYNERNERNNRGAMQLYNPNSAVATSSLESLTGLPMQALAQQVSRLQPAGGGGQGLHQQNVLINIQQFPTQPQPTYPQQHQPMYPHYPPHPGQPSMHNYGYQPPSHVYYPPAPGYPPQPPAPHMPPHPPPQHQMGQMQHPPPMGQQPQIGGPGQPQMGGPGQPPPNSMGPSSQGQPMPPPNQIQQPPNNMQNGYRPPLPPNNRPPAPRGPQPGAPRMPGGPRGPPMNQRTPVPGARPRAPMVRPRGAGGQPVRGQVRPRMTGPPNGVRTANQTSPAKRTPEQNNSIQAKRKKLDVLTPSDKDDDDCQVICMQPKNTDGGLPQIESVQGATTDSVENSIMHLSDSITLSVRNPPPKPVASPVKSDAKAVANILATRGITVTASAKSKENNSPVKQAPALPTALSLNGAVSIVASKHNGAVGKPAAADNLPTVDLTEDTIPSKEANSPGKNRPGLPYRCDLCPAQYPNAMGLNKHRQTYHKTTSGMCELGVPLINIKQPGIMQKLSQMGINNYIPLPSAGPEGTYALPIISTKSPGNVAALGATQMLSLGPVRAIPRPAVSNSTTTKK